MSCGNPNYAKGGGSWSNATNCYVKHNGSWVEADEGWKNINGTWTKFYDKHHGTATLQFNAATSSINEGNSGTSTHTITVTRSGNTGYGTATVDYATANLTANAGVDYVAASGTLSFSAGETSKNISITINGDTTYEANETFKITLSNPTNDDGCAELGSNTVHTVTITNDEGTTTTTSTTTTSTTTTTTSTTTTTTTTPEPSTISFNSATSEFTEGETNTRVEVNRSGNDDGVATVDYATSNGTATAGADYTATSGTLTFPAGSGTQYITIPITEDTVWNESNEVFNVTISNPTQTVGAVSIVGDNPHVVTILNATTTTTSTTTTSTTTTTTTTTSTTTTTTTTTSTTPSPGES